jgi:death-on-curing protein
MSSYYWLTSEEIIALHDELIKDFGGTLGILDRNLLESALARPQQLAYYQSTVNIADLAAAYGYALAKNHCFVDGNKRIALVAIAVFLLRNNCELIASEVEAVEIILDLVTGKVSQADLAIWIDSNLVNLST